ncbi:MAG: tRNA 2-thiouridine(34) synthase MnmA [Candidatus Hydrogenedentes bacterium]|nr:tRNA 2-thiouridine(34) synthase MnmA [Candidatus Hydrogenedentota bacterium]
MEGVLEKVAKIMDTLPPKGTKVLVGMSGGVDSSMTAWLLKERGCEVIGVTMSLWDNSFNLPKTEFKACFGPGEEEEIESARSFAEKIRIPFHVVNLSKEYKSYVLDYFREEYLRGRTPNPCARCNLTIKFGFLLEYSKKLGISFDNFATGHYARTILNPATKRYELLRGIDKDKDQSYFLVMLTQSHLSKVVFPLGYITKRETKVMAEHLGFSELLAQKESQDFVEGNKYEVLFSPEEVKEGEIVDETGRVLGKHRGIIHYTIGQRRGLGIGGAGEPYYVIKLDPANNRVIVGKKPFLLKSTMVVHNCNWISYKNEEVPFPLENVGCKIRIKHEIAKCKIEKLDVSGTTVKVAFEEPQSAITPGQIAGFYSGDVVLGGGIIEKVLD